MAAVGLDLAQINANLGAYSRQKREEIYEQVFDQVEFENMLTTIPDVDDEVIITLDDISEVSQPYQGSYTPKGTWTPFARAFKVRNIKINYTISDAKAIQKSWVAWLTDAKMHISKWPLVRYILDKKIFNKAAQECEYTYCWDGLFVAPTPGTPGLAINNVDGFGTVLSAMQRAGEIVNIPIGTITATNVEEKLRLFCDLLPEPFKSMEGDINVSPLVFGWYHDAYVNKYGTNANFDGTTTEILGRNKRLRKVKAMKSSKLFWMTTPENMKKVLEKPNDFSNMFTKLDHYGVEFSVDWARAYGIIDPRYLFMSDNVATNIAHTDTQLKSTFTFVNSLASRNIVDADLTVAGTFTDTRGAEDVVYGFKKGWIQTMLSTGEVVASTAALLLEDEMHNLIDIGYAGLEVVV